MRKSPFITLVVLASILLSGCSKSQIPSNAHVQDLGVVRLKAEGPTPIPLSGDMSLYCVAGRPEQLPQKVEFTMSLTKSPDGSVRLALDGVPTPADNARLWLKHLSVPFKSGALCEAKIGEDAWIRFTPVAEAR
jgi:hypothetical protein